MATDLKQLVKDEFSGKNAQIQYAKKVKDGLWISEKHFFNKYLTNKNAKLLDIGCGTGRTTIPLFKKGYKITAIDFVPLMIKNAKKIAKEKNLKIKYQIGDATQLKFKEEEFDYAIFSNQGLTQIPGRDNRIQALKEVYRVLKKDGIFVFTVHPRVFKGEFRSFWIKEWIKFYILKPFGYKTMAEDFGDRFFDRENTDTEKTYITQQYIHIPSVNEMKKDISKTDFKILEINGDYQISKKYVRPYPPVFFVCRK